MLSSSVKWWEHHTHCCSVKTDIDSPQYYFYSFIPIICHIAAKLSFWSIQSSWVIWPRLKLDHSTLTSLSCLLFLEYTYRGSTVELLHMFLMLEHFYLGISIAYILSSSMVLITCHLCPSFLAHPSQVSLLWPFYVHPLASLPALTGQSYFSS